MCARGSGPLVTLPSPWRSTRRLAAHIHEAEMHAGESFPPVRQDGTRASAAATRLSCRRRSGTSCCRCRRCRTSRSCCRRSCSWCTRRCRGRSPACIRTGCSRESCAPSQGTLHAPQWASSVFVSTQLPTPHSVRPAAHTAQTPFVQIQAGRAHGHAVAAVVRIIRELADVEAAVGAVHGVERLDALAGAVVTLLVEAAGDAAIAAVRVVPDHAGASAVADLAGRAALADAIDAIPQATAEAVLTGVAVEAAARVSVARARAAVVGVQ